MPFSPDKPGPSSVLRRLSSVLICLSSCVCLARPAYTQVFNGRDRQIDVRVPRIAAEATIDGRLDEPAWQQAARLTGFSRYAPTDNEPADDSTDVLIWYSPSAIHFGIRAFAEPGSVRATLADRDKMYNDDYIGIFIGTFNDGRQATIFAANPLGVQGDGILVEAGQATGGGFGGLAVGREQSDISPDYVFQSKGRVTDFGYEIEIRIPFKSLTYQSAETQTWSFNVMRRVQSRGYEYSWSPARRAASSYIAQHGHLVGLAELRRGVVLDLNPVVTSHVNGSPGTAGYRYDAQSPEFGGNMRWGLSNNLTINATANPDFAEVESDAGQFLIDPRQALFFPEKRPFFLDGLEQFATPSNLVYTRRILSPLVAAKLSGKMSGTSVALLTAVDDPLGSVSGNDHPFFNILRVRRDVGKSSRLGIIVTDKEEGASSNRVAGADLRLVLTKQLSAQLQGVMSRTERPNSPVLTGPLWNASIAQTGRNFGARYLISGISDKFRTSAGFIGRPAIARANADHNVTMYGRKGALLESAALDVVVDGLWDYPRFVHGDDAIEKKYHFNTNYTLRGGWHVGASYLIEAFGFDDAFYSSYAIERHAGTTVDTIPFTGVARISNHDYVLSLDSPQFKRWAFHYSYIWGHDENFFEWAPGDVGIFNVTANWRPTEQLRAEARYLHQFYHRMTDGSVVGDGHIPRLKVEYQITRAIFVRVVGQYTHQLQDSLRDDGRTNDPILIRDRSGVYQRTAAFETNQFRGEWLFSFLPSPGTVIYLGYGSTMTEPESFRFRDLTRQNDAFFMKLSYLFRR